MPQNKLNKTKGNVEHVERLMSDRIERRDREKERMQQKAQNALSGVKKDRQREREERDRQERYKEMAKAVKRDIKGRRDSLLNKVLSREGWMHDI